jgi:hypothetical protein
VLIALLPLPWGISLWRRVAKGQGRELNPLLPATARLLLVTSGLLALGITLGGGGS